MENSTYLSTEAAAQRLNVKPQTLRAAFCRDGAYMGLRPRKLPNRMLVWPGDKIEEVLSGKSEGAQ